mmetsp:Transcript_15607/g.26369  ORF Transcript_15607/g.26369 Transcript_15607/m.26369 type:complete len:158 (+) Transcript_15607:207-680(+)|eukprot:CAMPEP_0168622866 /NCGR_PEP_ID=MMETSP0449_2-20121227/8510_1 /TAXON_ID=1082188 /ORGANISM="Strombidium rassoulzadegani, Strain ras09" /LENGTH=157 /DNA_ID=CAMNT_0008664189 /DNA_START=137 /DNA_END=610 /DNA_ORIENTATION=+
MISACEGASYIVHTASPFPLEQPSDENEIIKPAVEGTLAAMEAGRVNKIKRIVITSSTMAIDGGIGHNRVYLTTEDWTDLKEAQAYPKSKTLAEKAAWEFQAKLPESEKFEVVTINPGFILGKSLVNCPFSSGDVVKRILLRELPMIPNYYFGSVDV